MKESEDAVWMADSRMKNCGNAVRRQIAAENLRTWENGGFLIICFGIF